MAFFQAIKDLFDSIFRSNSPEVVKKQKLHKIELELRANPYGIYKMELVQPNFAEALRLLYENTRSISKILSNTIATEDLKRNGRFEAELIITGYSEESKELLTSLDYETRKERVQASPGNPMKVYEEQHRVLERLVRELNNKEFSRMDDVIAKLQQLRDLCNFNYITPLKLFDSDFDFATTAAGEANFQALPPATLETTFCDLYFIIADFSIDMSVANAVLALQQLFIGQPLESQERTSIISNLRKIESIAKNIISTETLKDLIAVAKNNPDYVPQKTNYRVAARKNFAQTLQEQYIADEARIKSELKDEKIKEEFVGLFGTTELEDLKGYNSSLQAEIGRNSTKTFLWITPFKVLKKFLLVFYTPGIQAVLNDIIVEGFFSNASYKTSFSNTVYTTNECLKIIMDFEDSFEPGKPHDEKLIRGLVNDSVKDEDFSKRLITIVDNINADAKKIIQSETSSLLALYKEINDLIQDAKKPASEVVSNLKVLLYSPRNKDNTMILEQQFPLWKTFFDIMKNYVVVGGTEK